MRVALAHDSFTQLGGAERVIAELHEMFPEAPIFTLVLDRKLKGDFAGWDIRTSWLQVLYNFIPKLQYLLPFIPLAVSSLDLSGYDVVISSSSSWIKNIKTPKNCIHICYCHTPTRFLWVDKDYVSQEVPKFLKPLVNWLLKLMKKWDFKKAQKINFFIANSKEVQNRISQYYHRDSVIIYPPVDTNFWHPIAPSSSLRVQPKQSVRSNQEIASSTFAEATADLRSDALLAMTSKKDYFLIAGRLQAHKKNNLIVEIFNEIGLPLHVAGTGRQEDYLQSIAKPNIKFLGRISDEQLRDEYSGAKGLIFPQLEDLGLIPIEAASCGTATIALAKGGSLETVVPGVTGELFETYDKEKIKQIILSWNPDKYSQENLTVHAKKFGKNSFKEKLLEFINKNNLNERKV